MAKKNKAEEKRLKELNKEYEPLYTELTDVLNKLDNFCWNNLFIPKDMSERTKSLLEEMGRKASELKDIAHNVEEHLAWG